MRAIFLILLLLVVGAGFYYWQYSGSQSQNLAKVVIGGKKAFYVEIADTPEKWTTGLKGRDKIGSDGMLFVFDKPAAYCFHMQGTRFPLDIVFIEGGQVVGTDKMEAFTSDKHCPKQNITYALELPASTVERYGIDIGEEVKMVFP
jgi:uncharacterized membrane protein (UPF0127 family)